MSEYVKVPVICMKETGEKLKSFREAKGFTRKELAKLINSTYQTIANWEAGRKLPSIDNLVQLSSIYDVYLDNLLSVDYLTAKNKNASLTLHDSASVSYDYEINPVVDLSSAKLYDWVDYIFYDKNGEVADGDFICPTCDIKIKNGSLSSLPKENLYKSLNIKTK